MKKQENLESNNFYVFLKVPRRIYFFITSLGQAKNIFHKSQTANYQKSFDIATVLYLIRFLGTEKSKDIEG